MKHGLLLTSLFAVLLAFDTPRLIAQNNDTTRERYVATLESPGGDLNFGLALVKSKDKLTAEIICGKETIPVDHVERDGERLVLSFPHYDSKIEATLNKESKAFVGKWKKTIGRDKFCVMNFSAKPATEAGDANSAKLSPDPRISGRWQVQFASSKDPAVGIFAVEAKTGVATGTFLTTTGDYRFLGGQVSGNQMILSCFDGAHAFLFKATISRNGIMSGMFWSRDSWKEKWTAVRYPGAKLPNAFRLTKRRQEVLLASMRFPDLDGKMRSLTEKEFVGEKGTLIYVFGSWCPNCHDAGKFISQLQKKYADRGIKVIGIAFELTGDQKRDAKQVRTYLKKNKADFPVLLVGTSDKKAASEKFTIIDRIRSYPTTIFVNQDGEVTAIHTGFSGPATGAEHERLQDSFHRHIMNLIEGTDLGEKKLKLDDSKLDDLIRDK